MATFLEILELLGLLLGAIIVLFIIVSLALSIIDNIAGTLYFIYLLFRWPIRLLFGSFRRRASRRRAARAQFSPLLDKTSRNR